MIILYESIMKKPFQVIRKRFSRTTCGSTNSKESNSEQSFIKYLLSSVCIAKFIDGESYSLVVAFNSFVAFALNCYNLVASFISAMLVDHFLKLSNRSYGVVLFIGRNVTLTDAIIAENTQPCYLCKFREINIDQL